MKKRIYPILLVSLLAILISVSLTSCNGNDALPNETTTTPIIEETEPDVSVEEPPKELVVFEDGVFNFTIVRPDDTDYVASFSSFYSSLYQTTSIMDMPISTDVFYKGHEYDPEKYEIVCDIANYPETRECLDDLGFTEYIITRRGNKIILTAHTPAALEKAYSRFAYYINAKVSNGKLVIPENFEIRGNVHQDKFNLYNSEVPAAKDYDYVIFSDAGDGIQQATLTEASQTTYDNYLSTLENNGFTLYAENKMAEIEFATYTKDELVIHTYFTEFDSQMRILAAENLLLPSTEEVQFQKICEPSFTLIGVEMGGSTGGLGCMMRLADGSFILYDGGYNTSTEAKNLDSLLRSMAPDENNIIIRAWVFSHGHSDHYGTFKKFSETYASNGRYKVESFIYNFCDTEQQTQHGSLGGYSAVPSLIQNYWKGAKVYKALTGQVYKFAGCDMEILYCMSDFLPETIGYERSDADLNKVDGNLSTMVNRFIIEGQKILTTGDTSKYNVDEMCDMYGSYLKSEIMTVPHHGHNRDSYRARNGTIELYQLTDPAYVLWPAGVSAQKKYMNWNGKVGGDYEANYYLINSLHVKELFVAGSTNQTLVLPYTGKK